MKEILNKLLPLLFILILISCNRENLEEGYIIQKGESQSYDVLMIREKPTFILDSLEGVNTDLYIKENLGYFHLVSHSEFDSLNKKLDLKLDSRNDFSDLSGLGLTQLNRLINEIGITLTKSIKIEKQDSPKYIFLLNRKFWKNTYNGDSFIEFIQDHGVEYLTNFKYFDDYNLCLTTVLAIIERHTSFNRINCENLEANINSSQNSASRVFRIKNKELDKIFDGSCTTHMFGDEINQLQSSNLDARISDLYSKSKRQIFLYDEYFNKLNQPPYFIIKI